METSKKKLENAAIKTTGEKSKQQLATAAAHFDDFLRQHEEGDASSMTISTITHQLVTSELLGRFGSFLFMKINKLSAARSYLSQVKLYFFKKWQGCPEWSLHPHNSSERWYTDLHLEVKKMYTNKAIVSGEAVVNQAPPMYRDSLRSIASYLFLQNTPTSLQERDLLVTQWHCMDHAGESGVQHSSNRYVSLPAGALQFVVGCTKTTTLQTVHAFCDASSWEADTFHTKASHLVTCLNLDDTFQFRNASANSINKMLGQVCGSCEDVTQRYQSHSGRRGCVSEALAHSGVSVTEVIAHGGWAFDAVSRVFLYFSGMDTGDMRVGRVVAGWPDSGRGGIPPSAATIPENQQPTLRALTTELFKQYLSLHDRPMLDALSSSLIMYYEAVCLM